MATRTFQFYGQGYGDSTAEITATLNGEIIYSGEIPTVETRPTTGPGVFSPVLLFTGGELDSTASGAFPMTITANKGNVIMSQVLSNYVTSSDEFSMEFWHTDSRTNVTIDGIPQPLPEPPPTESDGGGWEIYEDQVLTYDLNVLPGVE